MRPSAALRAFFSAPASQDSDGTGFTASAADFGGKAGHIISWAVTIVAMVALVAGITLQLVWGG